MAVKTTNKKKKEVHPRFYTQDGPAITPNDANLDKTAHVLTARELAERKRKNKAQAKAKKK